MTVGLYKRPDTFSTLVDSIIFSTARVRRLWIVCNGSPYLELFRAKAHELAESLRVDAQGGGRAIEVAFFGTEKEVGYYERFLRALVVNTQYLAFIDDDMVIGRRVLEVCLHALNTRKFYGLIGIHGPLLLDRGVVDGQRRMTDNRRDCRWERAHFQNAPSVLTDFLYNFWVGETEMFRHLFRSAPLTLKTGEDMMLSFAVQHHAKLRCLSLDVSELEPDDELFLDFCGECHPSLKNENRSWTDDGTANAEAAAGRAVPALALDGYASDDAHREHNVLRQRVLERLWRHGWPLVFTREWASREEAPELLVVADEQQARVAVADKLLRSLDATWLLLGHGTQVRSVRITQCIRTTRVRDSVNDGVYLYASVPRVQVQLNFSYHVINLILGHPHLYRYIIHKTTVHLRVRKHGGLRSARATRVRVSVVCAAQGLRVFSYGHV